MARKEAEILFAPCPEQRVTEAPFAVLDIEARAKYPGEPINTLYLGGGFYDGNEYTLHTTLDSLLAKAFSPEYDGWSIYAHNGSGYDFLFMLERIIDKQVKFEAYRTGGRFFLQCEGREFLDSMCVLRGSLHSVARQLGVNTQKWDDLPNDFYSYIETYDWQPYLKVDCLCLYECIHSLRAAMHELGAALRPTLASTALSLFQRQYLAQTIKGQPWDSRLEVDARASYVGGRTEIFRSNMGRGGSWDINSSYPFAMLGDMPTDFESSGLTNSLPDFAICDATVKVPPEEWIPPLHYYHGDKLYFPTGTWRGYYTSAELRATRLRYGTDSVRVHKYNAYKHAPIFRAYVSDLYARRADAKRAGNAPLAEACKGLMNSLYGKMGMQRARQKVVNGPNYYHYPWNDPKALRAIKRHAGMASRDRSSLLVTEYSREHYVYGIPVFIEHAPYILPHIASWITADARLRLQGHLDAVGRRACYCDTDSVYAESENPIAEYAGDVGTALGKLKLEATHAWVHFSSPKVYLDAQIPGEKPAHLAYGNVALKGAAKGLPRESLASVEDYLAGRAVPYKHMTGALDSLRRFGTIRPQSEWIPKQAHAISHKRSPEGRAWTVEEIQASNFAARDESEIESTDEAEL